METSIAGRAATAAVRIPRVGIGLGVIGLIVIAGAGALAARRGTNHRQPTKWIDAIEQGGAGSRTNDNGGIR